MRRVQLYLDDDNQFCAIGRGNQQFLKRGWPGSRLDPGLVRICPSSGRCCSSDQSVTLSKAFAANCNVDFTFPYQLFPPISDWLAA